jgi:Ni/Fe-hydrogenase 1 B-type cytochrome subunit
MNDSDFKRVLVWSGWLRLSHWSVALATLGLLLTGWQLGASAAGAPTALDFHYYSASVLVFGVALRLVLMVVGKPHECLAGLLPRLSELRSIGHTLRFYLSLGRMAVPRWYAHNPLWKPVYLAVYAVLVVQVATGSLMQEHPVVWRFYLPAVHGFWAQVLLWFSLALIFSVALHDVKGKTADVSAMLNGYRLFSIDRSQLPGGDEQPLKFVPRDRNGKRDQLN